MEYLSKDFLRKRFGIPELTTEDFIFPKEADRRGTKVEKLPEGVPFELFNLMYEYSMPRDHAQYILDSRKQLKQHNAYYHAMGIV